MKAQDTLVAFNRGVVSRYALARGDLKRLAMSAEEQTNWMPMALGPMALRVGWEYRGAVAGECRLLPFIFAVDDTAGLEFSAGAVRVWVDDTLVTRPAVTAAVSNGTFAADLSGWTDADQPGATSSWSAGQLHLLGDGTNAAKREQAVAVAQPGVAHALRITVTRGPVVLRVGAVSLGAEFLGDTTLGTGTHSIVVVPTSAMYVQLSSALARPALVESVAVEGSGVLSLPSPYGTADLALLRYVQSGDVVFIADGSRQPRKVERRSSGSWSIVEYEAEDGPFRVRNVGTTTIAASGITGSIALTASAPLFSSQHVGGLWRVTSQGQKVVDSASAANVFSDPIRVFGIGESRRFAILVSGTFVATVTLQRSVDELGSWEDVTAYTAVNDSTLEDGLDNQIIYYRLGVKTGQYTSGTVSMTLNYSAGGITGVVRVTGYTSETAVSADVLDALGGTDPTSDWAEGQFSNYRGWPSAVTLHDGRLFFAGKDKFNGSVTDQFTTFDPDFEGDAGPISRSIGAGPVDRINWLLSLSRLIAGADMTEIACRSSSFDEPLTPTNFTPKKMGTQGTARIGALEVDNKGIFVARGGQHLYELAYSIEQQDYNEDDLTKLCPEFLSPGVRAIAVQRKPDTRIHCVRTDGTVAVLVLDRTENLTCWVGMETDGLVEDVMVLPGTPDDRVVYVVNRAGGRFYERWAQESECRGGAISKLADSFVYSAATSGAITGLGHLEGQAVVVWADGRDLGEFTVSGGQVTLPEALPHRCAGLGYSARFKSTKLQYIVAPGQAALGARKQVHRLGVVLADTHANGLFYGPDFDTLDALPLVIDGADVDPDEVHEAIELESFAFPGAWTIDSRVCLEARAPRAATVMAAVIEMSSKS